MKRYFIVAGDIHQVTGGYRYDAHMVASLRRSGQPVEIVELAGIFPGTSRESADALDGALARCKSGAWVMVDGLVTGGLPQVLEKHATRLHLVALIHHPLADEFGLDAESASRYRETERQALAAMAHVIVTSAFTARRLTDVYGIPGSVIDVVEPGVEPVSGLDSRIVGQGGSPSILCVATLIPRKGHGVLIEALSQLKDLDWSCDFIGDQQRDPGCTQAVHREIARRGLADRVRLRGILAPAALERAYAQARLFVLPSWYEGYGMVVAEALQHGLPIVTTTGGALAQTLPPQAGIAVAPGDAHALARALRRVLCDPVLHDSLSAGAQAAAGALRSWDVAGAQFAATLERVERDGRSGIVPRFGRAAPPISSGAAG